MVLAHDITKGQRTQDVKITQNITFETMLLAPNTLQGLKDSGFYKPSPIQLYGIPIGKCGFDLLLEAKSGTGKTAVFSIIALETLDFKKGLQVVILTPTREIAAQICDVLNEIGSRYKDLHVAVVMGGLPYQDDVEKFKKSVHIVVGSPGRLKHLIQNKHINISAVRLLVLDEADKLMEKSFLDDIKLIHTSLPKQKQVIMSSATYSDSARAFIHDFMQNANHVCPDSDSVLLGIEQKVTFVKYNSNIVRHTQDRFKELLKILTTLQFKQCLVFCNYQARVSEVHRLLKKEKWPSEQLYGQQEQVDRLDALKTLQQYKCRILVSTDLAARGIDASNIDLIVNFEPPHEWQTYLHRIGRAGRFGSYGIAITILSEGKETQSFKDMFKSMELTINMNHLWTDKEFNVKVPNTVSETEDVISTANTVCDSKAMHQFKEVNRNDIWNMLSQKPTQTISIESFESLCKSQAESKNAKIESFSDLMLSMQNPCGKNSDENVLFKHIEMKKPATRILDRGEIDALPTTNLNNDKVKKYDIDNMNKTNLSEGCNIILQIEAPKDINELNRLNRSVSKGNFDDEVVESSVPIPNTNNPLLHFEIPAEFSSTKYKTKSGMRVKHSSANVLEYNKIYDKDFTANVKHQCNNEELDKNSNIIETETNNETKSVTFFKMANNSYTEETKPYCKIRTYNLENPDDHIQNYPNSCSRRNRLKNNMLRKTYIDWYNQLQIKTQWIEQAVYIDEMSRL